MTTNKEANSLARGSTDISKLVYDSLEITQRFEEIFASWNLKKEIADVGNKLNSFFNRRRSLREFTALSIALWNLALESSFPNQEEEVFRLFLTNSPILGKGSKRKVLMQRIQIYKELLAEKKHSDFTPIAIYMAGYFSNDLENRNVLKLKLSLTIRRLYQFIFEHLIK
jgi:hypothetical protein